MIPQHRILCNSRPSLCERGWPFLRQMRGWCAALGNWEELVLLMGHVSRQCETISDWWELRHAWRLHMEVVAAAAYRIGLRVGRDGQETLPAGEEAV
jgi:hypothetical protein